MFLSIILALLLCVALCVFAFASCKKSNKGGDATTIPATTETTIPETTETYDDDQFIVIMKYDEVRESAWWYSHDTPRKTKRRLAKLKSKPEGQREKYTKHVAGFNKSQWHMKRYAGWAPGRTTVDNDGGRTKIAPKNRIEETHYGFSRQDRLRADRRRERKNRDVYRDSCYEEWI